MQVLVVDDDSSMREMLRAAFHEGGHVVTLATDGVEALELLERLRYDLVVTDLQMPGLDGVGLMDAARAAAQGTRWIVITADPCSPRLQGARDVAVLAKPFRLHALFELVG